MAIDKEEIIEDISHSKIPKKSKVEQISKYLGDPDSEVVCAACYELGRLKARDAIDQITPLMASKVGDISNMAICSLTDMIDMRDVALLPALHKKLEDSHYLTVLSSIEALGKIQSKESIPFLVSMLNTNKTGQAARVIESLGEIGDMGVLPIVENYLEKVLRMDYGVKDRGGTRGCELHPRALEHIAREAIKAVTEKNSNNLAAKRVSQAAKQKIYELIEPKHSSKKTKTKFGGNPDWLERPQWPIGAESKVQMRFICQISLEIEFPHLIGKMAYIFMTEDDDFTDGTWELESGENAVIIQPGGVPLVSVKEILTGPTREEYYVEEKMIELSEHSLEGVRIGGTPVYLQEEERPLPEPEWPFLVQIDSCSVPFEINFGDAGVGYAYINVSGTSGKFLWQCH